MYYSVEVNCWWLSLELSCLSSLSVCLFVCLFVFKAIVDTCAYNIDFFSYLIMLFKKKIKKYIKVPDFLSIRVKVI